MASITIRNVPEDVHRALRVRAQGKGDGRRWTAQPRIVPHLP